MDVVYVVFFVCLAVPYGELSLVWAGGILDGSFFFTIWMPFLALTQMVVYVLPCLIPFQCASAPGEKRKRKRGERGRKRRGEKRGEEKKVLV